MKKVLILIWVLLAQNAAFSESYGIFKSRWNEVPVNQYVTAHYSVEGFIPDSDKKKLKVLIRRYDAERISSGRSWDYEREKRLSVTESSINEILRIYGVDLSKLPYTKKSRYECRRLECNSSLDRLMSKDSLKELYSGHKEKQEFFIKILKSPVQVPKSVQVKVRSLEFKHINSESENLKAAFRGEKTHYCAVRGDVDWQGIPSQVNGVGLVILFYDSDGLEVDYAHLIISRDDVTVEKITLYPDPSYGKPVRFEIKE